MKLHVFPPSPNAKKALFANAHFEAGAEIALCDISAGDQFKEAFLALNPNAKMPVLEYDDGTSLWESNAIVDRLAAMTRHAAWPASDARYDIMRWQFWESCHWTPACARYLSRHLFHDTSIDMEAAEKDFRKYAAVLNGALENRDWLVGDGMTTAEISIAPILSYRDACQIPVADYPNIKRMLSAFEALPAWVAAHPEREQAA